jgi:glycosyltransferase involved in cell wall biosynthesis
MVHVIPGLTHGGAEWDLVRLLSSLPEKQFNARVICLKEEGPLAHLLRERGIQTVALGMKGSLADLQRLGRLRQLLSSYRPDLIQGWLYHGDFFSAWAARDLRIPVLWNLRQAAFVPSQSRTTRTLARLCAKSSSSLPSAIICCSKSSREAHLQMGYDASKMVIIENGFDTEEFYPDQGDRLSVRQQWGFGPEEVLVGIVGRLDPAKDIHTFLRAFAVFAMMTPTVKGIWIGGDDPSEIQARRQAVHAHGLDSIVEVKPATFGIEKSIRALDLLVSSSKSEGFGNVVGEALASAVPCIATNVGAAKDLVQDAGYIVPPQDVPALTQALEQWFQAGPKAWHKMGEQGRLHIQKEYPLHRAVRRYARLYQRVNGNLG